MIEDLDNVFYVRDIFFIIYGVNGFSVMNRVVNFDVCQCFFEDIMYIFFEGVVFYEIKQFLKVFIDEKCGLIFKVLNYRLESFNYGYMYSKDKLILIVREILNVLEDVKLKQSGQFFLKVIFYNCMMYF